MAGRHEWPEVVDFLALLTDAERRMLLQGFRRMTLPAASVIDFDSNLHIVEAGLVRLFQSASDGRQASLAYLRPHEMFGNIGLVEALPPARVQMVYETTLVQLSPESVYRVFEHDIDAWKVYASILTLYLVHTVRIIAVRSLGSMRDRLAFDLLERAAAEQLRSGRLAVIATQEELANSIGSAREVVSRHIADFRRAEIIGTSRAQINVVRPERLWSLVRDLVT